MGEIKKINIKGLVAVAVIIFVLLTGWLVFLLVYNFGSDTHAGQLWAASYQVLAWYGAFCGLYLSSLWGRSKSLVGRANLAFALGILSQSFGQSVFSYYFYKGIEVSYPSLADLGFFGSIPFYIWGILLLASASGAHLSFRLLSSKIQAFFIPTAILVLSYFVFLRSYVFDWSQPLTIFLDFGYPFGQALYISIAIVAYLLTKNFLGGLMKNAVLYFIAALVIQFFSDYTFLYQVSRGTYVGGFEVDFLYMLAYFMMTLSLLRLGGTYYKIRNM